MRKATLLMTALWCVAAMGASAHPGHVDPVRAGAPFEIVLAKNAQDFTPGMVSGQGALKFRVLHTSDYLPGIVSLVLERAHGGFAVDRREGRGEIYFALPEAGIIQISNDFERIRNLNSPEEIRATNMHNTTIWYDADGNPYLAFPAQEAGKVFTTTLDGFLKNTLDPPGDFTFDAEAVNAYFKDGGKFVPTDVEMLNGAYFITTGYSSLDYVLTADVIVKAPDPAAQNAGRRRGGRRRRGPAGPSVTAGWNALAFGGKGSAPGQFGTGHGITIAPDGTTLAIADRPNSEVERFSAAGEYQDKISLPAGSWPCDIDYSAGYALVGCLHGPDRTKGAPIYILKDDKVVSTIMPKEELGLANFQHIHNAVLIQREGKLYIVAQAWNPGDFAILEQVTD